MTDLPQLPFNKISLPKKAAIKPANKNHPILSVRSYQQQMPIRYQKYSSKTQALKHRLNQNSLYTLDEVDEYPYQIGAKGLHNLYRQKKKILSDIKKSVNQSRYYEDRQKEVQRVYRSLQFKQERAEKARKGRMAQRQINEKARVQLRQQEMRQKINLKSTIQDSKASLLCSRIAMKCEKFVKAQSLREQIFQEQNQIQKQKLFNLQKKKEKFQKVKSEQKSVKDYIEHLSINKIEKARHRRKLQIHTMAIEKQQIQKMNRSVKSELSQSITKFKLRIDSYKNRIEQMRKKLGHSRVESGMLMKRSKPSFTETSDQFQQRNERSQLFSDDDFQQE